MKALFTCKDVSKLASAAMDRELSWRERIGIKIHLWVCIPCQHYVQHLRFLHRAAGEASEAPPKTPLPDEAKERMRKLLNGQ